MSYLGLLAMISIAWCLYVLIVTIAEGALHKYHPVKDDNSVYSGGRLKGETSWRLTDGTSSEVRILKSDYEVDSNLEIFLNLVIWVLLPAVALYKLLGFKEGPHLAWSLLICSLFWLTPYTGDLVDFISRVEISISVEEGL